MVKVTIACDQPNDEQCHCNLTTTLQPWWHRGRVTQVCRQPGHGHRVMKRGWRRDYPGLLSEDPGRPLGSPDRWNPNYWEMELEKKKESKEWGDTVLGDKSQPEPQAGHNAQGWVRRDGGTKRHPEPPAPRDPPPRSDGAGGSPPSAPPAPGVLLPPPLLTGHSPPCSRLCGRRPWVCATAQPTSPASPAPTATHVQLPPRQFCHQQSPLTVRRK